MRGRISAPLCQLSCVSSVVPAGLRPESDQLGKSFERFLDVQGILQLVGADNFAVFAAPPPPPLMRRTAFDARVR